MISIASMFTRGLNLGIDFTGGILLEVHYPAVADLVEIRDNLTSAGFERYVVQEFGNAQDVLVRLPPQPGTDANALRDSLFAVLAGGDSAVELRRVELVSAQVGEELTEQGGLAMIFALLMIRALTYGPEYAFGVGCQNGACRERIEWEVDLTQLVQELGEQGEGLGPSLVCPRHGSIVAAWSR